MWFWSMMRFRVLAIFATISLAIFAAFGAYEQFRDRPLNVIVLTVDSWRADAVTRATMPNLFAAAQSGVEFSNHRAVSAWTGPNVVAVLTGLSSFEQGLHARGSSLPGDLDLLTKQAVLRGWEVAGLQAFMQIDLFKNLGFAFEPDGELEPWLIRNQREGGRFFLWYHYLQTHLPYDSAGELVDDTEAIPDDPEIYVRQESVRTLPAIPAGSVAFRPSDKDWIRSAYMRGIEDFDSWFAEFWKFFKATGLDKSTILIVTADHGEELLERGLVGHASTTRAGHLREEIVRIPLFIWAPSRRLPIAAGSRVNYLTDHLMIAPTIAGLVGIETSSTNEKRSLWEPDPAYVWTGLTSLGGFSEPDPDDVTKFVAAATDGKLKVQVNIDQGKITNVEKWNLQENPNEAGTGRNVLGDFEDLTKRLQNEIAVMRLTSRPNVEPDLTDRTETPNWLHPRQSGAVRYDDIAESAYLSWSGDKTKRHVLEYEAGTGFLSLKGELEVEGARYDFGAVDQRYWNTWVVPYERVRFRVRNISTPGAWSEWIELQLTP